MIHANDLTAVARAPGLRVGSRVREDGQGASITRSVGAASRSRFATKGTENVRGRAAAPEDDR